MSLLLGDLGQQTCDSSSKSYFEIAKGVLLHCGTHLAWTQSDNGIDVNWHEANSYCKAKGEGWRLPTLDELEALYDSSQSNACFPGVKCHVSPRFRLTSGWPWSSDNIDGMRAWYFSFDFGYRTAHRVEYRKGSRALCVSEG